MASVDSPFRCGHYRIRLLRISGASLAGSLALLPHSLLWDVASSAVSCLTLLEWTAYRPLRLVCGVLPSLTTSRLRASYGASKPANVPLAIWLGNQGNLI